MGAARFTPIPFPAAEWGRTEEGEWIRHIGSIVLCYWIVAFRGFEFLVVLNPLADVEAGEPEIQIEDHYLGRDCGRLVSRAQEMMLIQGRQYMTIRGIREKAGEKRPVFRVPHVFDGHFVGSAVSSLVMMDDTAIEALIQSYFQRCGSVLGLEVVDG